MKKIFIAILISLLSQFHTKCLAENEINIAFTIDNKYTPISLFAMESILKNNDSNSDYNFYIVGDKLSVFNKNLLKTYAKLKNVSIKIIDASTEIIDGGRNLQEKLLPKEELYLPRVSTARILLPILLPDIDRVLYIDPDIIVLSDLKELYEIELEDKPVGMVIDIMFYNPKTYNQNEYSYANSGLMLFDLKKWREDKIVEQMISYAKEREHFEFADQDIINPVLKNNIKMLDPIWNNQWEIGIERIMVPIKGKGILHYSYKIKPWNFLPHNSKLKRIYIKNWNKSFLSVYQLYYLPQAIFYLYKSYSIEEIKHIKEKIEENK